MVHVLHAAKKFSDIRLVRDASRLILVQQLLAISGVPLPLLPLARMAGNLPLSVLLIVYGRHRDHESEEEEEEDFVGAEKCLLHLAAENGHVPAIQMFVSVGADLRALNDDGLTPLLCAVRNGHSAAVAALLKLGADASFCDDADLQTPMHVAALNGHAEVIKLLLSAGADVDSRDVNGLTPLHYAASEEDTDAAMTVLIAAGATVSSCSKAQQTPLHLAITARSVEVLVGAGAQVAAEGKKKATPLHFAAQNGHVAVVEALVAAGASAFACTSSQRTPLHYAAQNGRIEVIDFLLLSARADISCCDYEQRAPLHLAAQYEQEDAVKSLVAHGADVNSRDHVGLTPLHLAAAENENIDIINALITAGADASSTCDDHLTPLHYAMVQHDNSRVVEVLVRRGADLSANDSKGRTPLYFAIEFNREEAAEALILAGANVSTQDANQATPLHWAAQHGRVSVIKALLEAGANAVCCGPSQITPFHLAVHNGSPAAFDLFVNAVAMSAGDDAFTRQTLPDLYTLLHIAVVRSHEHLVKMLTSSSSSNYQVAEAVHAHPQILLEMADNNGWTPLHHAVYNGNKNIVRILLDAGADVHKRSNTGWTPLDVAAALGVCTSILPMHAGVTPPVITAAPDDVREEISRCRQAKDIASGGFGQVFLIKAVTKDYVVKCPLPGGEKALSFESTVMARLDHPHIVKVDGCYTNQSGAQCMVMEVMNCGSLIQLWEKLCREGRADLFDETTLRHLMKQALKAFQFLHKAKHTDPFGRENMTVIHHDVKPHNMLVHQQPDGSLTLKLADFGLCRFEAMYFSLSTLRPSLQGTRHYFSPEAGKPSERQYTAASDIYSWAQTFIEAAAKHTVRKNKSHETMLEALTMLLNEVRLTPAAKELLAKCIDADPESRPPAKELLQMQYFQDDAFFHACLREHAEACGVREFELTAPLNVPDSWLQLTKTFSSAPERRPQEASAHLDEGAAGNIQCCDDIQNVDNSLGLNSNQRDAWNPGVEDTQNSQADSSSPFSSATTKVSNATESRGESIDVNKLDGWVKGSLRSTASSAQGSEQMTSNWRQQPKVGSHTEGSHCSDDFSRGNLTSGDSEVVATTNESQPTNSMDVDKVDGWQSNYTCSSGGETMKEGSE